MENQILIALKNNKLLKNILFDDLNLSNIKGDLLTISEGEILFREGNDSDFLYLVVSGEINLLRKRQGSKATSLLFNDHDFLGCEEFIESSKRQATAVALRDSYIIALTKDEVDNLIDQNDEILHNIYEAINANDMNHLDAESEIPGTQIVDFKSTESINPIDNSFASKVFQSTDIDSKIDDKNAKTESQGSSLNLEETTKEALIKDDDTSSQPADDDHAFINTSFNVPSSEISPEEFNRAAEENIEESSSTDVSTDEGSDEVISDSEFNDIVLTDEQKSDVIEDELKDKLEDTNNELESKIEQETEDLLDKYEDEVASDGLDPVRPVDTNERDSSRITETADLKENTEDGDSDEDHEFLLNQSLEKILTAQAPITDLVNADDPEDTVDELQSDESVPEINDLDENLNEQEDESTNSENLQDVELKNEEKITTDDIGEFVPEESQFIVEGDSSKITETEDAMPDSSEEGEELSTQTEDKTDEQIVDDDINVLSVNEDLEEVVKEDEEPKEIFISDQDSIQTELDETKQEHSTVQPDQTAENEKEIEATGDEISEDVFKNYDDDKSLEPLIPSSFKINFNQDNEPEDSESEMSNEKLSDSQPTEDNQLINPEDDFNFDERFGKIDPFYDAELANNETYDNEEKESATPEEPVIEKSDAEESGFIDAEPFTTPIPEQDDEQIIIKTEELSEGENVMLDNEENESNEIEETSDLGSELNTDDISNNVLDSQVNKPPVDIEKKSANEEKHSSNTEWEQTANLLEKINKAAEQVNSNIQIDEVLKNIVDVAVDLTTADRGTLYIVDKNKNEIWSKVAMGNEFKEIKLGIGEGIAGWVAQTGEVINLDKVQDDPRFNTAFDKSSGYETKSMLCFPIKDRQSEVVGVVQLLNSKNGSFTKLDEEFLESLSIHAAMALQNAALVEKLLTSERVSSLGKMANFLIQDIKKPIMVSKRYAEHLKSKSLDQDVNRVVEMLLDQLNHIADLVQSTSSYSEGQIVLRSVVSKLNETLDDCVLRLDSLLRASACQLTKKFDNELNVKISEKQFYQAIQSIVKNACQAMPEGGNILLSTEKADDKVLIKIKDQGLGIPDSLHDKIFEPFMTHGKKDATGLGLSITKKIIEEHGGTISVISNVGEGATFVIELPIVYAV